MSAIEAERLLFEAAGTTLHSWTERDYRRPINWDMEPEGDYTWSEIQRAFELWLVAKGIKQ